MICERCGAETRSHTMSIFNTDEICMPCKDIEESHPAYEEARDAELKAVLQGNYNFPGVGLPADLRAS